MRVGGYCTLLESPDGLPIAHDRDLLVDPPGPAHLPRFIPGMASQMILPSPGVRFGEEPAPRPLSVRGSVKSEPSPHLQLKPHVRLSVVLSPAPFSASRLHLPR